MARSHSLALPCRVPVLALSFLACVATGLQLSVNNHAADFTLSTELGPPISLSCLVHNSSQAEELLWYRGNGKVGLKEGNKVNISNICISPVNESDNGVTFTCRLARDKSVQVSVILDVQFPPQLSGEETLHVEEEKDVTLTCNSKSNPQAQSTWLKDNQSLTLQQSHHEVYQTSEIFRLSIKKVQKSDNGTYTCVMESPLGRGTRDFYLIVEDKKPVFPTEAVIAAAVVVSLTILFGIVARKDKIFKCFKKPSREIALS
ncbi:transmembrane and immunoglobulin domain-containing protein 1 isoform X2 [Oenanthe melanoleuca]|uniref:transmembrane and immunoglobulin domain-containing protein 1 isoform X2 n=1 Tax=Oenanthe melanoleuca TaxID=2939378 RepID=UPI0024C16744|nr:transmembrane and immunoglobulin domain-containing protein 1 isoform X2 [Oenanthe melanoleuca]XP_056362605.1 transmembrane and immunoglobulin domain-containing protein 1 isoform X2 [Oenanthe melanoleuca]